jgi:hypothetical protein
MIKINRHHSVQRLLLATALPLGLLAAVTIPAYAGVVTVTGGWGTYGSCGSPGGAGGPAFAATTTPGDASNTATAQGGHSGQGGAACTTLPGAGGPGGPATATATTTNIKTGSASATANATGGTGGLGGAPRAAFSPHAPGGPGGAATATSSASGAGLVTSIATAHGGDGGRIGGLPFTDGTGGAATSAASGQSTGGGAVDVAASASGGAGGAAAGGAARAYATGLALTGSVQANASANGGESGVTPGTAFAQSDAKNSSGEALTTASAPGGGAGTSPSASTAAGVGSVSLTPANITPGQAVSNAIRTGPYIGEGAMSAGYDGLGPLQYEATATFDFKTSASETLYLNLLSDQVSGIGFDSLELLVLVDGTTRIQRVFSSSGGAETFLATDPSLGTIAAGSQFQSIEIEYFLDYKSGTSAVIPNGFGFTYELAPKRFTLMTATAALDFAAATLTAIPEPSTWAMMLIGFAGLACAGYRASRKAVAGNGLMLRRS